MHPVGDNLKVEVSQEDIYDLGAKSNGAESGIVVEVPEVIHYFGKHSFSFEESFMAKEKLKELCAYFASFKGKRVWWETFQDRGRRVKEGDKEYVYLKMSDILAYHDNPDFNAQVINDTRSGSFRI